MEAAVSNVGSVFTDDQVNQLTLTHFENLQVNNSNHRSLFNLSKMKLTCVVIILKYSVNYGRPA